MTLTQDEVKAKLMQNVQNALLAFQNDLELRIARTCKHDLQLPASVGVNMAVTISKRVADIHMGLVLPSIDQEMRKLL